jgi:cytochrome P450
MADIDPGLTARPDHVPPELVMDFDLFDIPGGEDDVQLAMRAFQQDGPDIFWTPRNGGHWVVTRAEDIAVVQRDWERFSNQCYMIPKKPAGGFKEPPLDVDPPRHTELRRPLTVGLMPRQVHRIEDNVRQLAVELIEAVLARGHCEFVDQIGKVLPISIFLDLADLPREDRKILRPIAQQAINSPTQEQRAEGFARLETYLRPIIRARRETPGDDLISQLVNVSDGGRRIGEDDAFAYAAVVLFGGFDSVASMLGLCIRYLARNPDTRRDIVAHLDDEAFMRSAAEEMLRRHGMATTSRLVVRDTSLKDARFKAGEMVTILHMLAGLDERFIPDPLTLDLRRPPINTHGIFGSGPHACPGAVLARRELQIFLQEWLRRIPDYAIAPGTASRTTMGTVACLSELHLTWPATA